MNNAAAAYLANTAAYDPAAIANRAMVTVIGRSSATAKFNHLGLARSFAADGHKPMRVMLGDDGKFWVVTPRNASILERAGFSYAA